MLGVVALEGAPNWLTVTLRGPSNCRTPGYDRLEFRKLRRAVGEIIGRLVNNTLMPLLGCADLCAWRSRGDFLLGQQRVVDLVGNADATSLGERFGVLVVQERAPHPDRRSAPEGTIAIDPGLHLADHRVEELRLE